jgi:ABC-2 type transport system permease protein
MLVGFKRYFRIWKELTLNSFRTQMSTSFASAGYLLGKFVRIGFFLIYLLAIFRHVPSLKGYNVAEVVLFFMTFNIVDVLGQFLVRGLYGVKYLIEEGDFDKILTQPAHALFRISSMNVDLLDLITLPIVFAITAWAASKTSVPIGPQQIFFYVLLLFNAMVITYAFHVFIGAMSVKTQELEGAMWVYRDIMTLGRFPVTIYADAIRWAFVTVMPIAVMISFPAQALLGLLTWKGVLYSLALAAFFHLLAQAIWRHSLRQYTSISS